MLSSDTLELEEYNHVFKALSDMTRLKMMWLLYSIDSKISVSEMIEVLQINQYNASKHLKILKDAGMIYRSREGRWKYYYYLNKDTLFDDHIKKAVMSIPKELIEEEIYRCKIKLIMREDCKNCQDSNECKDCKSCEECKDCIDRENCVEYQVRNQLVEVVNVT